MKHLLSSITFLLIAIAVWYSLYSSMPKNGDVSASGFSTENALKHVKEISKEVHYVGSPYHAEVVSYLTDQLKNLGLEVEIQEDFSISDRGTMSKPKNILAKIKGRNSTGKALLLLSHYDSDDSSSLGASDAASGVATILEGLRAYLDTNQQPENDIIVCFTDGEELGLNGAYLFVKKHPWAKDVGLVLNFEARGSGGPSYMLLETNTANRKLVEEFKKANPEFPVTNSLAYSIYKLLPNDTDLTVFRKKRDIEGLNFAFIDDHFDYHTVNDNWQNLDINTLAHQGSYLMPLLNHFSKADLSNFKSEDDVLYFNFPFVKMMSYPFEWIYPSLGVAFIIFFVLLIYGIKKKRLKAGDIGAGFFAFIISMGLSGALGFALWKVILIIYPEFQDMLHGFTYNGYYYILAVNLLAVSIFFRVYSLFDKPEEIPSLMVAPLFFWLVICIAAALYLPGASYFIIPVLLALVCFFIMLNQKRPLLILTLLISISSLFLIVPFIASFPVALGLKILFSSAALTVLLCGLMLPVIGYYQKKSWYSTVLFVATIVCLVIAHIKSDFNESRQKPNSLVYFKDLQNQKNYWLSYDYVLDDWTKNHIDRFNNRIKNFDQYIIQTKYNNNFLYASDAKKINVPFSDLSLVQDTLINNLRTIELLVKPERRVNRYDLYLEKEFNFADLKANGIQPDSIAYNGKDDYNFFTNRWTDRLLTYHVNKGDSLVLNMTFSQDQLPEIVIYETSYDLLQNQELNVEPRADHMIPKPFVVNDAIMLKKKVDLAILPTSVKDTVQIEESVKPVDSED